MSKDKEPLETEAQETAQAENTEHQPESEQQAPAEATPEQVAEEPVSEVDKLKTEVAEHKEKYLRIYSEFENFRRRTARERIELLKTASEGVVKELLPILDDFDRAEKSFGEAKADDPVREGFTIIMNKFMKTLEKQGLKPMESPVGKPFDTELHEAVTQFPAPSEDMKGKVVDQLEKGYLLHDKVIRYAKVVVGS